MVKYALISPTFKRPEEVTEFLQSLTALDYPQDKFQIVLGDGTPEDTLRPELKPYESQLPLTIVYEEFLPVSDARNRAAEVAEAEYFIFLDSDCIIPPGYLKAIDAFLETRPEVTLFGGPDAASDDFTDLQKAINYSMTSFLTTGGIRGGKASVTTYHPRGFNMGMSAALFRKVNGYNEDFVCGEDVEFSIRLLKAGAVSAFIPEAHVYHKRRSTIAQFHRQVFRFGAARPLLAKAHPGNLKITHLFPTVMFALMYFSFGVAIAWAWSGEMPMALRVPLYITAPYLALVGLLAAIYERSLKVGLLAMVTTVTMNKGYGSGFFLNFWQVYVKGNAKGIKL